MTASCSSIASSVSAIQFSARIARNMLRVRWVIRASREAVSLATRAIFIKNRKRKRKRGKCGKLQSQKILLQETSRTFRGAVAVASPRHSRYGDRCMATGPQSCTPTLLALTTLKSLRDLNSHNKAHIRRSAKSRRFPLLCALMTLKR